MQQPDANPIPWVIELHSAAGAKPIRATIHDWIMIGQSVSGQNPQPDVDLHLWNADKTVSCQHVLLYREDDALLVMDLNSEHGSALNGHRLETSV
ncbi:MAG: FHA domain-containing protein, partial [Anaerolineae bacterium]|nr:FHA domain-containing protein [Anaerolineae bacterium]